MSLCPSPLLRHALLADAAVSRATGLVMFAGAGLLAGMLGLPEALLRYAGLILVPFAGWVAFLARQEQLSRAAIGAVVGINVLWATDSLLLLVTGWVTPNVLGVAFVVAQALIVAAFAFAQAFGMRGSPNRLAAA